MMFRKGGDPVVKKHKSEPNLTDAVARRRPLNLYHSSLTTLWGDGEDGVMLRSRGVGQRGEQES